MAACFQKRCTPNVKTFALPGFQPTIEQDCEFEKCCDDVNGDGTSIVTFFKVICFSDFDGAIISMRTIDASGAEYTPINPVACPATDNCKNAVIEKCWKDAADCSITYRQILCVNLDASQIDAVVWIDAQANIIAPPGAVVPCEAGLAPYMASTHGVAAPAFEPFNSFVISKPNCCELTVTTNAGTIVMRPDQATYSSERFDCLLTGIEIAGPCVGETTIFVNRA